MWKLLSRRIALFFKRIGERCASFRRSLSGYSPFRDWRLWILLTVLSVAGYLLCSRIAIAVSPSLSHRIFILDRSGRTPRTCDYVLFTFSSPLYEEGKRHKAIKEVICREGERLTVDRLQRNFYCEGRYVATAKVASRKEKPLPLFVHNGAIPKGMLFVTGAHRDSFDSRYWGFLEEKTIEAIARPLF
jgi:signal peptidase I/conjugal transfer pilin signal peptidase TrbI